MKIELGGAVRHAVTHTGRPLRIVILECMRGDRDSCRELEEILEGRVDKWRLVEAFLRALVFRRGCRALHLAVPGHGTLDACQLLSHVERRTPVGERVVDSYYYGIVEMIRRIALGSARR